MEEGGEGLGRGRGAIQHLFGIEQQSPARLVPLAVEDLSEGVEQVQGRVSAADGGQALPILIFCNLGGLAWSRLLLLATAAAAAAGDEAGRVLKAVLSAARTYI